MATAITNVRLFDGANLSPLSQVVIEDGLISDKTSASTVIDGRGGTLLPGLIDCHVHLDSMDNLKAAASCGVTTLCDMVSHGVDSYRNHPGVSGIRTSYGAALWPVTNAAAFVEKQVARGADYIKIIIEDPPAMAPQALSYESVLALVKAAHRHNKLAVVHAVTVPTYQMAVDAGADIVTHIPIEAPLPEALIAKMTAQKTKTIPTLVMMKGIAEKSDNPARYANAEQSVRALLAMGIPVMAGTDSNHAPYAPVSVDHGTGLQEEFRLLAAAGMPAAQILRSATGLPAEIFGFHDIGTLAAGRRADLLLVEGDPTEDIEAVMNIQKVWIGGLQVK